MRQKLANFMIGRNGVDALGRASIWLSVILMVVTLFTHQSLIYILAIIALGYSYFRMMSRNVSKRYLENQKFLNLGYKIKNAFKNVGRKASYQKSKSVYEREQKKLYKIFYCPSCKQKIRAPKGKGKICITCPKCKLEFVKRT